MKKLFSTGFGLILAFATATSTVALQPTPITEDSNVTWSQVVEDPFDGTVVYDRHYTDRFSFVSSWSRQGIRATYTQKQKILVGYQTQSVNHWVWDNDCDRKHDPHCKPRQRLESYPVQVPIYQELRRDRVPKRIWFAISGKILTYDGGAVSTELASALSSAPDQNMRIRLEWATGKTTEMVIGKDTVKAWKTIFGRKSNKQLTLLEMPSSSFLNERF